MQGSDSEERATADLFAIFDRRNADGSRYYTDAELRALIPLFVLASKTPPSDAAASVLGELASRLDPEELRMNPQRAIVKYYQAHPIHPELLAQINRLMAAHAHARMSNGDWERMAAQLILNSVVRATIVKPTSPFARLSPETQATLPELFGDTAISSAVRLMPSDVNTLVKVLPQDKALARLKPSERRGLRLVRDGPDIVVERSDTLQVTRIRAEDLEARLSRG